MDRASAGRVEGRAGLHPRVGARGGWHWAEWSCELVGTALLLLGGLSAICLDFSAGSPVASLLPSYSARLLLTGLLFAGTGSLVALSPLGRRSGAHLNPAVTLAFTLRRHLHGSDVAGYVVAQLAGAFLGAALVRWWWGARARSVELGVTQPGPGIGTAGAAGIEAAMTSVFVLGILIMVSSHRTARWTPLYNWIAVALLVWRGAGWTGTSLNPARSLAPAVLLPETAHLWAYLVGPLGGAVLAVAAFAPVPLETRTAKLFHDARYPTTMATTLPVAG